MVPGFWFLSLEYTMPWVTAVLVSEAARACFEFFWAESRFGMAMAARMPMIATTINSSIRVKPFDFFRSIFSMTHPPSGCGLNFRLPIRVFSTRSSDSLRRVQKRCHFQDILSVRRVVTRGTNKSNGYERGKRGQLESYFSPNRSATAFRLIIILRGVTNCHL